MQYWDRIVDPDKRSRGRERQDPRRLRPTSEPFEQKRLFERTDSDAGPQKSFLDESVTVPGLFPTDGSPGSKGGSDDPNGVDKKISAAVDAIVIPASVTDHGELSGLSDDDHGIYLNNTRGDIRYFRKVEHLNSSAGASDAGKPIKLNVSGLVDPTMISGVGVDHGGLTGLADDDHTQYHLTDGTRAMSGNLDMGTNAITNVGNVDGRDVSADGAELDVIERMFDGIIVETIDIDIVVESTVVKLQIQAVGGGDLTCRFAGVSYTLDCTPPLKVNLTDGADDENPVLNYVFITEAAGVLTLGANTTGFPASAYCPVATVFVQSDASVVVDGVYKDHAWVDHMNDPDGNGHLQDINAKLRGLNADYVSGVAPSDLVVSSPDAYISTTAGVIRQVHDQVMPAVDMQTPAPIFVINDPTTPYKRITTFDDITQDASGGGINNKYMNLVLVAVASENQSECKLYLLLPTDTYVVEAAAIADTEQTTVYAFPSEFVGTAVLVARYTVQAKDSGAWSQSQKVDLRGTFPASAAGGGGITDHGSLFGLTDDDHTQYHNDARGDARYYTETELDAGQLDNRYFTESEHLDTSAGAGDSGKPIKLDASGLVDSSMLNNADHVVGPGSATNNAIARFDLTTGKLIQNSTATLTDGGILTTFVLVAEAVFIDTAFGATEGINFNLFNDTDESDVFLFDTDSLASLTATSGVQVFLSAKPEIAHGGTASYTAIEVDVDETTLGSGTKLLLDLQANSVSQFSVANDGVVTMGSLAGVLKSASGIVSGDAQIGDVHRSYTRMYM